MGTRLEQLSWDTITELPSWVNIEEITDLDLCSYYGITRLSPVIGQLTSLTVLDLSSNELLTIPGEIGQLSLLTSLEMQYNLLHSLPIEIGQLTSLISLNVCGNMLSTIPAEFGQLISLTDLNLSSNDLVALPIELGKLELLEDLDLSFTTLAKGTPQTPDALRERYQMMVLSKSIYQALDTCPISADLHSLVECCLVKPNAIQ